MKFLYEVEPEKMSDAWNEGFKNNCTEKCDEAKSALPKLNGWMTTMRLKDTMSFQIFPDKVTVTVKGQEKGSIPGAGFSKAMLSVFLGPKPPSGGLKDGLLGKNICD